MSLVNTFLDILRVKHWYVFFGSVRRAESYFQPSKDIKFNISIANVRVKERLQEVQFGSNAEEYT